MLRVCFTGTGAQDKYESLSKNNSLMVQASNDPKSKADKAG